MSQRIQRVQVEHYPNGSVRLIGQLESGYFCSIGQYPSLHQAPPKSAFIGMDSVRAAGLVRSLQVAIDNRLGRDVAPPPVSVPPAARPVSTLDRDFIPVPRFDGRSYSYRK